MTPLSLFSQPLLDRSELLLSDEVIHSNSQMVLLAKHMRILRKPDGLLYVGPREDVDMFDMYLAKAIVFVDLLTAGTRVTEEAKEVIRFMGLANLRASSIEVHGMPTGTQIVWNEISSVSTDEPIAHMGTIEPTYSGFTPFDRWMHREIITTSSGESHEMWTPMPMMDVCR